MMLNLTKVKTLFLALSVCVGAQAQNFNGLDMGMGNLYKVSKAKTRSLSPENFNGAKG